MAKIATAETLVPLSILVERALRDEIAHEAKQLGCSLGLAARLRLRSGCVPKFEEVKAR